MGASELAGDLAVAVTGSRTAPTRVISDRRDALVVRVDGVVAKAHAVGTSVDGLRARLALAADPDLRGVLLAPCAAEPLRVAGRPVTTWPVARPVEAADHDEAPWTEAGELLAGLHTAAVPAGAPAARWWDRLAEAVDAMGGLAVDGTAARSVRRAYDRLDRAAASHPVLVHGDWHLGQLVRTGDGWRLIDVDDLGVGDPAWDLARPAALFAVGVLPPEVWFRFLDAYARAGGPAVPPGGDPWPAVDAAARQGTVLLAARGLATAARAGREPDDIEWRLVDGCARMVHVPPPAGRMVTSARAQESPERRRADKRSDIGDCPPGDGAGGAGVTT
jgi:hypothetical protein